MNFKFQTLLLNFRYGCIHRKGPITVEWFKYDLDENLDDNISGFNQKEEEQFSFYTVSNPINFGGRKQYRLAEEHDLPIEELDDLVPNERLLKPEYLLLFPSPKLTIGIAKHLPIILTDEKGMDRHNYELSFGAIGRILY